MKELNLDNFRHIHFIGIGGISMYLLAIYCKKCGIKVSGSDISKSKYTTICKQQGIKIHIGHKRKNVQCADLVVYNNAIDNSNVELFEARMRKITTISRAELLRVVCKKFKCVIGVSGTHGKTTTSAMIYHLLKECGKSVSCHIGGDVKDTRLNPNDEYLVVECCEYNRSFLSIPCDISVVLNIDNDHLDCYCNMYNLQNAFKMFAKQAKIRFVFDENSTKCIKVRARRVKPSEIIDNNAFVYENQKYVMNNVFGVHNINNATMAVAVGLELGISSIKLAKALKSFESVGRRCQVLGKVKGVDVIIDYAHHPTEIKSLYDSLKSKYKQVFMVFQPHTYSRTKILINEFVKLFVNFENLAIFKEYSAREDASKGFSAYQLSQYLDNSVYIKNYKQLKKWFNYCEVCENSCVVFVGAGDINLLAEEFVINEGVKTIT